ncbi:YqgE/AlgH family protein [Arsenicicoccus piscis]|uniref:UPF0301 protein GCM10025862_06280 n=1 Tax=Arsenicicoccus piscis TaxID=673954 RepID=A0ABQ6HKB6_9MICO|nr:YqgE/AlgH family protein [Arsenicicoccus piscis]MCH8628337.1 YqgE/AlgH family protein [Arsenicicoccus piscis]GMA18607.1 UPF0301 protein [Arsenicicoccus piscis]
MDHNGGVEFENLSGRLLVATPMIDDGIFRRAVVLVLDHGPDGAQGVVVNKPSAADVGAVLPTWAGHASTPDVLFHGGPVATDTALGVVSVPGDDPEPLGVRHLFGSVGLVDLDTPPVLVLPHLAGLRVFAGYAGWSAGQLESEVVEGSWYVVDAEPLDLFTADSDTLWRRVLRRQPDRLAYVAYYPDDPELN